MSAMVRAFVVACAVVSAACRGVADRQPAADSTGAGAVAEGGPLTVFTAGSLARPMRAALDSFAAQRGTTFVLETAGSLELARRLLDLGKNADVVALADEEVFPRFLMPARVSWYARFARNRMVLAYSPDAKRAEVATSSDWRRVLLRPGLAIGRSDADLDPAGYRTLLLFQLAERHYRDPGLAKRLEAASPPTHVRPKSAELVALLQAHELDYAWMYESSARGARLPFVRLPEEVDLGEERLAAVYDSASVRVAGATRGDTLDVQGTPIRYGISIPTRAQRPELSAAFLRYIFSDAGRRILRAEYLDVLPFPTVVGSGAPPVLDSLAPDSTRAVERAAERVVPRAR
jgi:molybdate/tungstate transport system substrate-binding protein